MKSLITKISQPIVTRLGTGIGAFLAGQGVAAEKIAQVEAAFAVLALLAVDLTTRHLYNKGRK